MAPRVDRNQPAIVGQERGQWFKVLPASEAAMQEDDRLAIRPPRLRNENKRIAAGDSSSLVEHAVSLSVVIPTLPSRVQPSAN